MKSYTDIEQSKKLVEILPLESADMIIVSIGDREGVKTTTMPKETFNILRTPFTDIRSTIPCWSLAALLNILQKTAYFINEGANVMLSSYQTIEWDLGIDNSDLELITEVNPVDACVEMITKLHELKML